MFKLVVLSALVAVAVATPSGYLHSAPLAYSAYGSYAVPSAVSHQSRTDVVSKPVIATTAYAAAPAVAYHAAAPAAYTAYAAAPAVAQYAAYSAPVAAVPTAVSHQSRTDVVSKPVIATTAYAAAPVAYSAGYHGYAGYAAAPVAYSAGYGYGYHKLGHYY